MSEGTAPAVNALISPSFFTARRHHAQANFGVDAARARVSVCPHESRCLYSTFPQAPSRVI